MRNNNPTCIDLFAGAGGLALGGEMAGLHYKLLIEKDEDCINTLKYNRPEWNTIKEDIITHDFTMDSANIISGGFPCQSFSHAGRRKGLNDTRGTLFHTFAHAVDDVRPEIFVAENVKGLLYHDSGETLETMINVFEDLSYNVKYKLLNAWDYGVAQKRERLFIVGTLEGYEYHFPEPTSEHPTLRDVLIDVPESKGAKYKTKRRKLLENIPQGSNYRSLSEEDQKEYLGAVYDLKKIGSGAGYRLAWDQPSPTILTVPSSTQMERVHPDETRPLTVRESARIQSFPDTWKFCGTMTSQYHQIGNAVPPLLAQQVLQEAVHSIL